MENNKQFFAAIGSWCKKNQRQLTGGASIAFGLVLIFCSRSILINVLFFAGGVGLIYYGLYVLRLTAVTRFVDEQVKKIIKRKQPPH